MKLSREEITEQCGVMGQLIERLLLLNSTEKDSKARRSP